jgi:hypothetical protein
VAKHHGSGSSGVREMAPSAYAPYRVTALAAGGIESSGEWQNHGGIAA